MKIFRCRFNILLWLGVWHSVCGFCASRTPQEALSIAQQWAQAPIRRTAQSSNLPMSSPKIAASSSAYYAVNMNGGFVLVSADNRLPEILGYSDEGYFDTEELPIGMQELLATYDEELSKITSAPLTVQSTATGAPLKAVEPLLKSKWGQGSPFNNLAPLYNNSGSQAVAGCVATAMAQVMYYYRYPTKGRGSHSYLWVCKETPSLSQTLSANFGNTTYRWSDMLDSYRGVHSSTQDEAVATLLYHCGVAVNMGFGASSGANMTNVPTALYDYFQYDGNYQRIQKVMYPFDSLCAIIRAELDAQRPVLMDGYNDEGGHAFVCDGYDTNGYFHINWGWNGSSDGYFLLSALNPGQQGIGGTSHGYNMGTSFYVGVQPATTSSTPLPIPQMASDSITVSTKQLLRDGSFNVSLYRLENFGLTKFDGYYGVALYDEDETRIVKILSSTSYTLNAGYHRTTAATMAKITIPQDVPVGTYHLCAVYKDKHYDWMRMMATQDDYYKTVYVASDKITFYDNNAPTEMKLLKQISFPDASRVAKEGAPLSFELKNTGGTFRGQISARIYKGNFAKGQFELMDSVVIRRNQTLSSALQQNFDSNLEVGTKYIMKLCWRANNSDSWHNFTPEKYDTVHFCLYSANPHLQLLSRITFDHNDSLKQQVNLLHCRIQNTGAPFEGTMSAYMRSGTFSHGYTEEVPVSIASNLTVELDIPCDFTYYDANEYTLNLRYKQTGDGDWNSLEPIANATLPITILSSQVPTDILENSYDGPKAKKYLKNGQIVIYNQGNIYNVFGQKLTQ